MPKALRQLLASASIILTWALVWAIGGILIGVLSILLPGLPWDAFLEIFDAPLPAMAIPGAVAGLYFSIVVAVATRGRRLADLSLSRFTGWGGICGLLVCLTPMAMSAVGLATLNRSPDIIRHSLAIISVVFVPLAAISAPVSLIVARAGEARGLLRVT